MRRLLRMMQLRGHFFLYRYFFHMFLAALLAALTFHSFVAGSLSRHDSPGWHGISSRHKTGEALTHIYMHSGGRHYFDITTAPHIFPSRDASRPHFLAFCGYISCFGRVWYIDFLGFSISLAFRRLLDWYTSFIYYATRKYGLSVHTLRCSWRIWPFRPVLLPPALHFSFFYYFYI